MCVATVFSEMPSSSAISRRLYSATASSPTRISALVSSPSESIEERAEDAQHVLLESQRLLDERVDGPAQRIDRLRVLSVRAEPASRTRFDCRLGREWQRGRHRDEDGRPVRWQCLDWKEPLQALPIDSTENQTYRLERQGP